MVRIPESGMMFLVKNENELFRIEKSMLYRKMGDSIKTVEFISYSETKLRFVEAKTSAPKPESGENFIEFVNDVSNKFAHSLDMYLAVILKRMKDEINEMSELLKTVDIENATIYFMLVVKGHQKEWMLHITEALNKKLSRYAKIWSIRIIAINDETAHQRGIIEEVITQ